MARRARPTASTGRSRSALLLAVTRVSRLNPTIVLKLATPGVLLQDRVDFALTASRPLERRRRRQLDVQQEVAVVLFGQEAAGRRFPSTPVDPREQHAARQVR